MLSHISRQSPNKSPCLVNLTYRRLTQLHRVESVRSLLPTKPDCSHRDLIIWCVLLSLPSRSVTYCSTQAFISLNHESQSNHVILVRSDYIFRRYQHCSVQEQGRWTALSSGQVLATAVSHMCSMGPHPGPRAFMGPALHGGHVLQIKNI